MVQIIAGKKGKGKTKHLLDMANAAIKGASGTVVYLDKSAQHMYELNNRIRLINVNEFPITHSEGFLSVAFFLRIMILRLCILTAS